MGRKFIIIVIIFLFVATALYFSGFELKTSIFRFLHRYEHIIGDNYQKHVSDVTHLDQILNMYPDNLYGIDISSYQGEIDWDRLKFISGNVPVSFVIIRATAGKNYHDKSFNKNWEKTKEKGFIRGAYHYYRPNENSLLQAENFIKTVKLDKGDLPPVLDIEKISTTQSVTSLKSGIKKWLDRIEETYSVKPIIYTSEKFYLSYLNNSTFNKYPIWIANFKKRPLLNNYIIWQFTSNARIEGIKTTTDVNMFNGNFDKLKQFLIK